MLLRLYVRSDCHLCGLAMEVLRQVGAEAEAAVIDDEPTLEMNYGQRIPVLCELESDRELDWPFDAWAVRRFLEEKHEQSPK